MEWVSGGPRAHSDADQPVPLVWVGSGTGLSGVASAAAESIWSQDPCQLGRQYRTKRYVGSHRSLLLNTAINPHL